MANTTVLSLNKLKAYRFDEWVKFTKQQRFIALIPAEEEVAKTLFIISGSRISNMDYKLTSDNSYVVTFIMDKMKHFVYPKKFSSKGEVMNFIHFISNVMAGSFTLDVEDWTDQFPEYSQIKIIEK